MLQPEWEGDNDLRISESSPKFTNSSSQKKWSVHAEKLRNLLEAHRQKIGAKGDGKNERSVRVRKDEPVGRSPEEETLALVSNMGALVQYMSTEELMSLASASSFMNDMLAQFVGRRARTAKALYEFFISNKEARDVATDSPIFDRGNALEAIKLCLTFSEFVLAARISQNAGVDIGVVDQTPSRPPEHYYRKLTSMAPVPGMRYRGYTCLVDNESYDNPYVKAITLIKPADDPLPQELYDRLFRGVRIYTRSGFSFDSEEKNYYGWHVKTFVTEASSIDAVDTLCRDLLQELMAEVNSRNHEKSLRYMEPEEEYDDVWYEDVFAYYEGFFYMRRTPEELNDPIGIALAAMTLDSSLKSTQLQTVSNAFFFNHAD